MKKSWLAATLCVLVLGATACGSDEKTPDISNKNLDGSYKIMVVGPFSTGGAQGADDYDSIRIGALAAAKTVNAAGGVNGKGIDVVVCDTAGDSNKSVACAQQAVREKVVATVGNFEASGDYLAILDRAKIPAIGAVGLAAEYTSPNAYIVYNGLEIYLGLFALMADEGVKDIAFPFQGGEGSEAGLKPIIDAGEALGLNITTVPVDPDQSDYSPIVAKAAEADGIIIGLLDNQTIPFVQSLKQTDFDGPVGGSISDVTIKELGDLANGLYSVNAYMPASSDIPAVKAYVEAMHALDKDVRLDDAAANAYNAVLIFARAVDGLSDVTGATVAEKLDTMGPVETGLRPATDFGKRPASVEKSFAAMERLFDVNVVYEQVVDGVLKPTDDQFHDAITGDAVPFE